MIQQIEISQDWRLEHKKLDDGLLGKPGERAYEANYQPKNAVPILQVPMTAQAAMLDAGSIPDPYVDMRNRDCVWMEMQEWWYFKDFDLDSPEGLYRLVFEGVNYRAEVWLNGVQLGTWEGTFLKKELYIDPTLLKAKGNRLTIRTRAQERAWEDGTQPYHRGFQNSSAHIRTQRPTPQYAHGWNWSPHLIAIGIWRDVRLEKLDTAGFEALRIHTSLSENHEKGAVEAGGVVRLRNGAQNDHAAPTQESQDLRVILKLLDEQGTLIAAEEKSLEIRAGQTSSDHSFSLDLEIDSPRLWWPNGYGEANLYTIVLELHGAQGLLDTQTRRQGFRRITFVRNTNDTSVLSESGQTNRMWSIVGEPYPWTLVVNGQKIFCKGSNWCPVDNLYRNRKSHVRRLLELARDAGYTMLRVWGGGLTESDYFYDLCDAFGLVCFQEFWFACGSAPAMDHEVFLESARSEIIRLRERTCLAFWGGGNEFNPDSLENKPMIDKIGELVESVDGEREFRRGSPYKGDRHGGLVYLPLGTTNKYSDLLPGRKRMVLMRSECAVGRSPARPAHIKRFIPQNKRWPIDWEVYENHHAQRLEWELVTRPFGETDEWEIELLHASVLHCVDSRYNLEYARCMKYECSGCLTWQLNASWPTFHREHVDWYGAPKPVYYYYKNACAPVIATLDLEKLVWHPGEEIAAPVYVVNDLTEEAAYVVNIQVHSARGELLEEQARMATVAADASVSLGGLDWRVPAAQAGSCLYLTLSLQDANQQPVYANTYFIAVSPDTRMVDALVLGDSMVLEYLGCRKQVSLPHYYTLTDLVDEPTEDVQTHGEADDAQLQAQYTTTFTIPEALRDKPLELFLPGVSADYTACVNGVEIGRHQLNPTVEQNFLADPLRWPTLPLSFHDIPSEVLDATGDNTLTLTLDGSRLRDTTDKRFGFTEKIRVQSRSSERERDALRTYFREMPFFTPITQGPKAGITVSCVQTGNGTYAISLRNESSVPACFVVLDLEQETVKEPVDSGATATCPFLFATGAFSAVLPGAEFSTALQLDRALVESIAKEGLNPRIVVRGLNVDKTCVVLR